ncbi:hypothetical protein F901_01800 [Acinetobacter dispersus]|nr:hypothetical protein F901_01800 [Acinetobacter dispersus]
MKPLISFTETEKLSLIAELKKIITIHMRIMSYFQILSGK